MQLNELYEDRVILDEELPMQISMDIRKEPKELFSSHWHEDIEMHYIVEGEADLYLNQTCYHVKPGDLLIANGNELHSGICTLAPYVGEVIIFDVANLSSELAMEHYIFKHLVSGDGEIRAMYERIFLEKKQGKPGYKQMCRAIALELLVYLCRNHVERVLQERESLKRRKDLERLNVVLCYIEDHYSEQISNTQLADMVFLSEDRFGHLFREGVGKPPLQYINEMRLKKALVLLKSGEYTVTEVSEAVGFRDYNHFGRLFRKYYGHTPHAVKMGKLETNILIKDSGIV